jgi:hypothetical protein
MSKARGQQIDPVLESARAAGESTAQVVIETVVRRDLEAPRAAEGVLLVAEGDSWFDYPFFDSLEALEDEYGYDIESVAHKGDTVEDMAYGTAQLDSLYKRFLKLRRKERVPKAVLLSGGGNDLAGTELQMLLNHKRSGLTPLNDQAVAGVIDERLAAAVTSLASAISRFCGVVFESTIPIIIHGYDRPVPDGRGYLGGLWKLPGPWLEPAFRVKGYADLDERIEHIGILIDRHNTMLQRVADSGVVPELRYLDLRNTLSNDLADYSDWWADELHPTRDGFSEVAVRFHEMLDAL